MADDAADLSYVQVATDGSGKKIRNLKRTRIVLDGVPATDLNEDSYVQVVALADANGIVLKDDGWRQQMLEAQRETNDLLLQILERLH